MATSSGSSLALDNKVPGSLSETDFTVLKCSHTWKINKFSYCWMKTGEKLESPMFSSETDRRIQWCLLLYTNGKNSDHKDNLSLYLKLVSSYKTEIRVKYTFSIVDDKGNALYSHGDFEGSTLLQKWDKHKPSCGADKFISRNYLLDTANGFIFNDKLTIYCEVSAATIVPVPISYSSDNIIQADGWGYTHLKVIEVSYVWTISNFSFCTEKPGEFITSPVFNAKNDKKLQWKLVLYPNGVNENHKASISIYLSTVTILENNVQVSVGFKILRENNETIVDAYSVPVTYDKGKITVKGYPEIMKRELLMKNAAEFMPDDKLTVHCGIRYVIDTVNVSPEAVPIKLQSPKRRLNDDLEVLLDNGKFNDVTLVVGAKELRAHKAILAARSPVFSAMFQHKPEKPNEEKVEIRDMNYEVLQEILWFIYTGTVKNLGDMACSLLATSNIYILEDLKFICEQELCSKLAIKNAAYMLILADQHNAGQLKSQAIDFINTHAMIVMDSPGFKKLSASHPQLVAEIAVKRFLALKKN